MNSISKSRRALAPAGLMIAALTLGATPASAASVDSGQKIAAVTPVTSRVVAKPLVSQKGWGPSQFKCLDRLWTKESGWNHRAYNRSSGAYGIPQALPGSKMASAGKDWRTNPATQIKWGISYIKSRYGTPCAAWSHSVRTGWY